MPQHSTPVLATTFQHAVLANGLHVVAEPNPLAHSLALGFFVRAGARDETDDVAGVSHFLEHMAFKGGDRYSAADVNRIFDDLGASYNASTSEETTCYYAAVLPEYLDETFDLLASLLRPALRVDDFETEKQVILEEIGMYDDMPAFALYERAMAAHFKAHPLGRSVLGSTASVSALTPQQMQHYHAERYGAGRITLAVAGKFDWDHLLHLVTSHCDSWPPGSPVRDNGPPNLAPSATWIVRQHLNQQHLMQLAAAPPMQNHLRYAAEIAALIVGEDGAGRLHWELVEDAYAESCDLSYNEFDGSGAWTLYLCCDPEETLSNLDRVHKVLREFNSDGPTLDEFERARAKVATRIVLQSERPIGRMSAIGGAWSALGEYRSVADDLRILEELTIEDIHALLTQYPLDPVTTIGLGPRVYQ